MNSTRPCTYMTVRNKNKNDIRREESVGLGVGVVGRGVGDYLGCSGVGV